MDLERIAVLLSTALILIPASNAVEWGFSLYGGRNSSLPSDVRFVGPDTDWTVHNVPWRGVSFETPGPYYGARLEVRPAAAPLWRIAIDYTHAKAQAIETAWVIADGTINGAPGPTDGYVGDFFNVLEFTDGLNIITVNAIRDLPPLGRLEPYAGVGVGITIPHVEVTGNSVPFPTTYAYRYAGSAAQVLIGARFDLGPHLSAFAEYRLSASWINAPLSNGDRIQTTILTNHLIAGLTFTFGRP